MDEPDRSSEAPLNAIQLADPVTVAIFALRDAVDKKFSASAYGDLAPTRSLAIKLFRYHHPSLDPFQPVMGRPKVPPACVVENVISLFRTVDVHPAWSIYWDDAMMMLEFLRDG